MEKEIKKGIKFDKYYIGCLLTYAYIFTSYVAQDIVISSNLNSLFLYAFLLSSAYILVTEIKLYKNTLDFVVWYALFMIFSAVLMLRMPDMSGVFNSFYVMIVAFFVSCSLQLHVRTKDGFRAICRCYSLSSVSFVILLFLTGNLKGDAGNRLGQEILGNANIFAGLMMIGTMYTVWLIVYDAKKPLSVLLWCSVLVLDLYSLILSGGRKYFIIPFVFLYILLWFKEDKKGHRHILFYSIFFAILIFVIWTMIMEIPSLYNAIGVRMEGFIDNVSGEGGDNSSIIRERMRILAFEKWWDKPVWGYGFDSFKYLAVREINHFCYSHCNYAELLYCGGILYCLLYYFFYFRILKKTFFNKKIPIPYKAFAVGVVLSLIIFDYGAVAYNSTPQICMLMMANCATLMTEKNAQGES